MPKGQETIRGRYTSKACNICRARKSKCDGVKPSCGACTAYGRGDECSWGRDSLYRKPRTEAHFEALRSRADALQAYVSVLEGMLAKCVCQDVSAHHQVRPPLEPEVEVVGKDALPLDSDDEAPTPGDTITQELCLPMQFLKLDDKLGLLRYGVALPLRFAGRPSNELLQSQNIADSNATYVLMVDGVDETACDLNFDWSRHLPPGIPLDRKEHDKILDLFFKFYSMSNFRVMPFLFLRDMHRALSVPVSQRPPKTPNYSPMLHNAILALASAFSDDPRIQDTRTKRSFMVAARDRLESECQKPDVSLVHSLGFMGTFHAEQGTPILGDCHHGMSARVSQALGLGLDVSEWVKSGIITSDEMRGRNYTHWTLFTWDVYWALCFGREPPSLSEKYNTPMPFVSSESDQILWHHPPANIPPQPNYITLIFSASTSLSLIARKIVLALYGLGYWDSPRREYVYDDKIMSQIDVELNSWKSQLPPEIDITSANRGTSTPQKLMLHCSYWWYFIVLHRPFLNRRTRSGKVSDQEIDHIKLCRRSAENTLELLETWSKLYSLRYNPLTLMPMVFSAGTIFLILSLQAALSVRFAFQTYKKYLSQAELCVTYLREMGQSWHAADGAADNLQALLDSKLKAIIDRRRSSVGQQTDTDRPNSNTASLAASGAAPETSVSADTTTPFDTGGGEGGDAWNWYEPPGNMDDIMGDMPWPQAAWDFIDDQSANVFDGLFESSPFAPPMSFPGADTLAVDNMPQFLPTTFESLDSTRESEHWDQHIRRGVLPPGTL